MTSLIHCIYSSAATEPLTEAALDSLLAAARRKNAGLGITGMLLYDGSTFFQVLEGPPEAVDRMYAHIAHDTRHHSVTQIIREPLPQRAFGEWSMGYCRTTAGELAGFNDVFGAGGALEQLAGGRARKLLLAFREGRWRARPAPPPRVARVHG